jgi:hypothetical protein
VPENVKRADFLQPRTSELFCEKDSEVIVDVIVARDVGFEPTHFLFFLKENLD